MSNHQSKIEQSKILPQKYKDQYYKDIEELKEEVDKLKELNNTLRSSSSEIILCNFKYI